MTDETTQIDRFGALAQIALALSFCLLAASALFGVNRAIEVQQSGLEQQMQSLELAGRAESQLDALATGVKRLADADNENAAEIVEVLRQNGVNIDLK